MQMRYNIQTLKQLSYSFLVSFD